MKRIVLTALCCISFLMAASRPAIPASGETPAQSPENELFFVAQKAFDDGFYDVAIRYIDQFKQQYPATARYTEAQLLLGQCYFFKNQYLKAFDIFQSIAADPKHKDATFYWLGETYFKGADYKQAQSYYQKVIEEFPQSDYVPQAYYSLGWSSFAQGDYDNAVDFFNKLLTEFPQHSLAEDALFKLGESYLNKEEYEQAIQQLEQFTRAYPQTASLPNAFFYLGECYYYTNDFLTANTYYAKAAELTTDPEISYMAKLGMGWIYLKLQKYDLAEHSFDEAREIAQRQDFSIEEIDLGKAALYTETKQYDQALRSYTEFLNRFPKSIRLIDAAIGEANTLYLLERYDEAIAAYQKLLERRKTDPLSDDALQKSYYGMAWAYLKKGDLASAIQTFETIAKESTNKIVKASAWSQIGDAYQENNQLTQALMAYDKILEEYPDSLYADYAQFQQGITFLKLGRVESAKISFQSLKANFPQSKYIAESNYYLGFAYFQNEEWNKAISQIKTFLESADDKTIFTNQANYILALSYFHTRDFQSALKLFQTITKNVSNQPSIVQTAEIFIGKCLFELGQTAEAIKHFQQITQLYPLTEGHQDALIWLGEYYLEKQDFQNAITPYQTFIATFPGSPKINLVYYEMGQSFQAMGEFDKALTAFRQVGAAGDKAVFAKAQLAIADIFSRETGTEAALETYQKIADTISEYRRDALLKIGKIYEQRDQPQQAIAIYRQALQSERSESDISNAELLFAIGDNYESLNNDEAAVEEYLKIVYLNDSENSWIIKAYLRTARIFENQEQWEQAKVTYQKILELNSEESKYAQERIDWISNVVNHQK